PCRQPRWLRCAGQVAPDADQQPDAPRAARLDGGDCWAGDRVCQTWATQRALGESALKHGIDPVWSTRYGSADYGDGRWQMRPYRTAMALALLLLLLPTWVSADPAEEQAIKQADKPTPVVH